MNFISLIIKDLLRKKIRLLLTILGISIGIFVCIIMLGIAQTISSSFKDTYKKRQTDIIIVERDQFNIFASTLDYAFQSKIREIPQVRDVASIFIDFHKIKNSLIPVFGWELNTFLFDNIAIKDGRLPYSGANEIIIGQILAENIKKKLGEEIRIRRKPFKIVGIFESLSPLERYSVIMSLTDSIELAKNKNKVNLMNVRLKKNNATETDINEAIEKIESSLPELSAQKADIFISEKTKHIIMGEKLSLLVTFITLVAVTLGLANIVLTSALEKKRFLSLLLMLGWQKGQVAILFLIESLLIAFMGGAIGLVLGLRGIGQVFRATDAVLFIPVLQFDFVLKILGLVFGIGFLAGILPIFIIINLNPVEIFRSE